jgi:hypothetical protein
MEAKLEELNHLEKLSKTSAHTLRHLEGLDRKFEGLEGMSGSVLDVLAAWGDVFRVLEDSGGAGGVEAGGSNGSKVYELVNAEAEKL